MNRKLFPVILILYIVIPIQSTFSMIEGLYCEKDNCYDLLEVTRDSSKSDIAKSYRRLAKIFHPDRHRTVEAKAEAEEQFKIIANAYEILKDDESRSDYDYMLDNPEEYYRHYYHYYRRRMTPKVDVRIVLIVTISVISIFQYYTALFRWNSGMKYLATQPKYRSMALQVAEEDGLLDNLKKLKRRNKEEMRAEEERIIRTVLENKMDIRGGYARPTIQDVLWLRILLLPKSIFLYFQWYFLWLWKFNIKGQEYGNEEKFYIIRKFMGISETQFEAIPDNEKDDFLEMELWIKENYDDYKAEKEEEYKRQMAQSGRMKSYRRYLKKHGPGRMYFDDS